MRFTPIVLVFLLSLSLGLAPGFAAEDGLVGHWRFDTAAESVKDLSGHGQPAQVTGGKVLVEGGRNVLALDGHQQIRIPSSPELNLRAGFSIDMKIKIASMLHGQTLVFKDKQYSLRVDPPHEESRIAFFPYVDGQWESRACSYPLPSNTWYHLVATWDGHQSMLWVNGIPFGVARTGKPPAVNDLPLIIASTGGHGSGVTGAIEYVKIYHKALSPKEIMANTFDVAQSNAPRSTESMFDFGKAAGAGNQAAAQGDWTAQGGATATMADNRLVLRGDSAGSLVINKLLNVAIDKKDWVSLRMASDKGSHAKLIFVTTEGAGFVSFPIVADQKPHTYVIEAWTQAGWAGKLLAMGLMPSNVAGSTTHIEQLQITEEAPAAEVRVHRIYTDSTLPRAQRSEKMVARLLNVAGTAHDLDVTLTTPEGIVLKSPAKQTVAALECRDEVEVVWNVEAERPISGSFQVTVSGKTLTEPAVAEQTLTFQADPHAPKSDYVPVPVPAKTKYKLWTHYCSLWKTGTHWGWPKIEPWPERKPVIGWYNEGSPEVADWHIKYMVEHGISGVMYCWYRTNINAPVQQSLGHAIHDGLLKARYLSMIKFGIMWENGCGAGVGSVDDLMQNVLPFWIDNYFSNPSYVRVDGKPVLYVWIPPNLRKQLGGSENVRTALEQMRAECKRRGLGGLYIVASSQQPNKDALETLAKEGWDASSAYCNNWSVPNDVTHVGDYTCAPYEAFVDQQESLLKFKRELNALPDISNAMMGWDARPWHKNGFFWSENTPEKFRDLCLRTKAVVDSKPDTDPVKNTAIFCCWNEFGEGHYIEPSRGKGFTYLDVIRDVFCEGSQEHVDVSPQDVGLASPDSWYAAVRNPVSSGRNKALCETAWSGDKLSAWKELMGFGKIDVRDGALHATSTTRDPAFLLPSLELRASHFSKIVVEMRVDRPTGPAQVFWSTPTTTSPNEATSAAAAIIADGQWHTYVFEVGKNPTWAGCITSLRFDPVQEKDITVDVKSIRVEE